MVPIKPLKEIREEHIRQVLVSTGGDVEQACRILGITVSALRRMMKEFGINQGKSDDGHS